jgi:hypothetical protein
VSSRQKVLRLHMFTTSEPHDPVLIPHLRLPPSLQILSFKFATTLLDHGATDIPEPLQESVEHDVEELEELGELDTIDNAQDQVSERTVQPGDAGLPQTPPNRYTEFPGASGSQDGTSSTPDDSPSLHVSTAIGPCVNGNGLLISNRAPLCPLKVAAL